MYFEDQLGIHPARWLHYPPLDDFLSHNAISVQGWEKHLVGASGLHITAIRSVLALYATFVLGATHRSVPSETGRHIYAALSGLCVLYYAYGNQVVLLLGFCCMGYLLLLLWPRRAGTLSWIVMLPSLVVCMERCMETWAAGEVDISGALMVTVLKVIALCYNRQDGARQRASEAVTQEDTAMLITKPPSPLHYASYILAFGNILAGPFNEFHDYMAFTARREAWAAAFLPGMWRPALLAGASCVGSATVMLAIWAALSSRLSFFEVVGEKVWQMPLVQRVVLNLLAAIVGRTKFYMIWTLSESGMNAAGFGFNGFADAEKTRPKFDRYINSIIWQVETCTSMAQVPKYWNVNTGVFLRRYTYNRLGGGFVALALTQIICSIWHGPCEGYLAFFAGTILMFQSSKVIFRQEKRLPAWFVNSFIWKAAKWFFGHYQLSTYANAFFTLKWSLFSSNWAALYWSPHIMAAFICLAGALLPNTKRKNGELVKPLEAPVETNNNKKVT